MRVEGQPLTQGIWFLHRGNKKLGHSNECIVMETFITPYCLLAKLATSIHSKQGGAERLPLAQKAGPHVSGKRSNADGKEGQGWTL